MTIAVLYSILGVTVSISLWAVRVDAQTPPAPPGVLACKLAKNLFDLVNEVSAVQKDMEKLVLLTEYVSLFPKGQKIPTKALVETGTGRMVEFMPIAVEILYDSGKYKVERVGNITGTNIVLRDAIKGHGLVIRPYNPSVDNPTLAWHSHKQRVYDEILKAMGTFLPNPVPGDARFSPLGAWLIDPVSLDRQKELKMQVADKRAAVAETRVRIEASHTAVGVAQKNLTDALAAEQRAINIERQATREEKAEVAAGARLERTRASKIAEAAWDAIRAEEEKLKSLEKSESERKEALSRAEAELDHHVRDTQQRRIRRATSIMKACEQK